jgi:hypothetical protein
MVAACANPACSVPFREEEGVLFRLETDPAEQSSNLSLTEYFWLCGGCSAQMTLRLDGDRGVRIAPLPDLADRAEDAVDFVHLNGQGGHLPAGSQGNTLAPEDGDQGDDAMAAASRCPRPECGALVVAYRPSSQQLGLEAAEVWDFLCPRCGFEFKVPRDLLIFQAVPKHWLLAESPSSVIS